MEERGESRAREKRRREGGLRERERARKRMNLL
jgi:hypothetical protein